DLGVIAGQTGSVTAEQRFGSALNLNVHFHTIQADGVWARGPDGVLDFHRLSPTRPDLQILIEQMATHCEAWLTAQGVDADEDPDAPQAVLIAASAARRVAAGPRAGAAVRRAVLPAQDDAEGPRRGVSHQGYGLHAGTFVPAHDRAGLERL